MNKFDIEKNWNMMANMYEQFTNNEESYSYLIEWQAIKTILPLLKDKKVLDLGCGTGRFSFLFEQFKPKSITGIDISLKMIEIGKTVAEKNNSIVNFLHGNIENISFEPNSFDFIFSSTTLHYIEDLDKIMKQIASVLKPNGECILSVIHPVYSAMYPIFHNENDFPNDDEWTVKYLDKRVRGYIQPWIEYNPNVDNFLSVSYHHTMSEYLNSFIDAGLTITKLVEPLPPEIWLEKNKGRYFSYLNTPTYAIFKLSKQ